MLDPKLIAALQELSGDDLVSTLRTEIGQLDLADRFTLIHQLGIYHHPETVSGAGSTLDETRVLREALPTLVRQEQIRSLLDIPCGDFHWMRYVDLSGVQYIGADIVPGIVAQNLIRYQSAHRTFVVLDATQEPLPDVDLVFSRDLLIHLSLTDIRYVLKNIAASGSRLLLTTHFTSRSENLDIESGDFRPVNLCCAPFWLPEPLTVFIEDSSLGNGIFRDRGMALWRIADVQTVLANS